MSPNQCYEAMSGTMPASLDIAVDYALNHGKLELDPNNLNSKKPVQSALLQQKDLTIRVEDNCYRSDGGCQLTDRFVKVFLPSLDREPVVHAHRILDGEGNQSPWEILKTSLWYTGYAEMKIAELK